MITKSNYVEFVSCPRALWYTKYHKDQAKELDEQAKKRIKEGNEVNGYATNLFPGIYCVKKDPNKVDIKNQVEVTQKLLKDCSALAEASFIYDDLFCAVDILVNNKDGSYDIVEVKASTDFNKHKNDFYPDVAFQKYVLEQCGLTIKHCYLMHLNSAYVRDGALDFNKLFIKYPIDQDEKFDQYVKDIPLNLTTLKHILKSKDAPNYGKCSKDCPYFEYCHKSLVKPNLIELNNFRVNIAHKLFNDGIVSLNDALVNNVKLTNCQRIQLNTTLNPDKNPYINKDLLNDFLKGLKYPIYHLDFETMDEAIPPFNGVSPYQQIPFQYSLHIEYSQGGKVDHKEFLASEKDSEYALAKQLCNDIPLNATSMAYNMSFEKTVLKHLANRFKDLSDHLMNIHNNMIDLLEPFDIFAYYDIKQHGRTSIKYVMPALCPDMVDAYHNLPLVHNGGEALSWFPRMLDTQDNDKRNQIRKAMLQYCELDTLSMVKVLNKLWEKNK